MVIALLSLIAAPPQAPVHDVIDTHYGVAVHDPYRYMEDLKAPDVQAWIKQQADYAQAMLAQSPHRDELLARIRELNQAAPYRIFAVSRKPGGNWYYLKQLAAENQPRFYIKTPSGQESLLLDPASFTGPKGEHASLTFIQVSPDEKRIAFGTALAGSEQATLHLLDVVSGKLLPETIDRMEAEYTPPCWLPDSSGFVYSRRRALPADAPPTDVDKLTVALLHKLGTDVSGDREIFGKAASPAAPMADEDFPSVVLASGSKFAVGKIKHGDAREITLYAAPIESLGGNDIPWKMICDRSDAVGDFSIHEQTIYLISAADAPQFKLVSTSLAEPDFAHARIIVAPGEAVVDDVAAAADGLYVTLMRRGLKSVQRMNFEGGDIKALKPNDAPSAAISAAASDVPGVMLDAASWTSAGEVFTYDPVADKITKTPLSPRGKFDDPATLESTEVMVKSYDGVSVPLSIIYSKGTKLDGSHPTLLRGYGSYGMVQNVGYFPTSLAWLERGGILAVAHVRGGGELGQAWHDAGKMLTKPNTWKDFIACGEYLIKEGYTSREHLAGQGGSAGGILIGRAITERPDLFAAAVINVGCEDMIRMETTTNGVPNIQEFGTITTSEGFRGLLEMSAYHHVIDGEKYPAVLLCHGINDPRVEPWMSAKMTARLQAATSSGKPVLFRVDFAAGHGIGSRRDQREVEQADTWAFLLDQLSKKPG